MAELIGLLIGMGLVAWWSYYLATNRGRNAPAYAFAGAAFGVIVVIILFIIGKTAEKKTEEDIEAAERVAALMK